MIKYIVKFFTALNANSHPGDIAHAVCLGLLLAILPKGNLTFPFLFFLSLFIRMNKGAFFVSFILLGFVTPSFDPLINQTGFWAVPQEILRPAFIWMENTPFVAAFKLSNTMVFGGLIWGLLLYLPVYILVRVLVAEYRKYLQPKLKKLKVFSFLSKIPLLKKAGKLSGLDGE